MGGIIAEATEPTGATGEESRPEGTVPGVGEVVLVTVTSHQPWGITARVRGYEHLGASLDVIRRGREPGVRRLARALPAVGSAVELTVGGVRHWDRAPWVWLDLTAP